MSESPEGAVVIAVARCPVHGQQQFRRVGEMRWWECPLAGDMGPESCGSVIPDEDVTPDGASVWRIDQARWVGAQRIWPRST